ncbi:MAG TPA: hypothetical protein P5064_04805 [Clostridia bacterium]|jgi:hypothetical protein|nr:hypothetical protein [Clostridiaceae bacterium]HOF27154.1 hypothetical protein [Clostridia bacterium]HOM34838.1 hypothetical protein [Clostridia bacterium]HOR90015.1 hypothetical protein [Clostridia bacterium]HOT71623.1 hypothetical protein [Clostridia bacterium]
MKNNRKTGMTVIAILTVIVIALLSVSCKPQETLEGFNITTFNSDIVIKRVDGQEPLNMPYRYAMPIIRAGLSEEVIGINISSVRCKIGRKGLSMSGYEKILVEPDSSEVTRVINSIDYYKGITTLSGIIADKNDSKITIYEGYNEELLLETSQNYAIIPSTLSKHINQELSDSDKVFYVKNNETRGAEPFKIIGEYTTNKEHDALYLSFYGMGKVAKGAQIDIPDYIDCMEIDVNEGKDLSGLISVLNNYFADYNVLSQYEKRINRFNERYPYMFVNTAGIKPVLIEEDTNFKKNIITVSRIDEKSDLMMSHLYGDALVKEYHEYSQYISDINIGTGIKGVNPADYPTGTKYQPYGLKLMPLGMQQDRVWMSFNVPPYHKAVTSISEIKRDKQGCEIYFYGNYRNRDLVKQREQDYYEKATRRGGDMKGYAIIPAPMFEAVQHYIMTSQQVLELCPTKEGTPGTTLYVAFTAIGYYELPEGSRDAYDVIYITYYGNNDKYKLDAFKDEYIESITIETRSDADMEALTRYLRKYFAPKETAAEYSGSKNGLGLDYEYCYTIKEKAD